MAVRWKLENTKTKEIVDIEKSVFKIGRHQGADLKTKSVNLSKEHAEILQTEDGFLYVKDNGTINGTYINEQRISPLRNVPLKHGDNIVFGVFSLMKKPNFRGPYLTYRVIKESVEDKIADYTMNDDDIAIIISDDEDDDLSKSQIFHISERIKSEPIFSDQFLDPYIDIKEEVKEMDYCSQFYQKVDLTEKDHFDSTSDLLQLLESGTANSREAVTDKNIEQNISDKSDESIEQNIFDKCEKELRVVLASLPVPEEEVIDLDVTPNKEQTLNASESVLGEYAQVNGDEQKNNKKLHVVLERGAKVNTDEQKADKNLHVVLEKITAPKQIKPPLVEPHFEESPRNRRKTLKRKSLDDSKEEPFKKPNNNTSLEIAETSMRETRKQRLREIADKAEKKTPSPKSIKGIAKVKLSESRGAFLIQSNTVPASTNVGKSSKDPRLNKPESKPVNNTTTRKPLETKVNNRLPPVTQNISLPGKEKVGLIYQISNRNAAVAIPTNVRRHYDLSDDINVMLYWNVTWILEQSKGIRSPPVTDNKPAVRIPSTFRNIQHYLDVMKPCILLEAWQYIFQSTFRNDEGKQNIPYHYVRVEHTRRCEKTVTFDCVSENTSFRPDDLCVVNFCVSINGSRHSKDNFGYITNVHNRDKLMKFSIVLKPPSGPLVGNKLTVKVIANIANILRQFRTLRYLEQSPLLNYILEPERLSTLMPIHGRITRKEFSLNSIQQKTCAEASELALGNRPGIYLIHGPPGTGKSSVIVSIVFEIIFKAMQRNESPNLLVTAPSNAAINALIEKLSEARSKLNDNDRRHIKLIRVGPETSMSEVAKRYSLREFTRKNILSSNKNALHQKYSHVAHQIDVNTFLKQELGDQYDYIIRNTEETLLSNANIICTTLNSSVSYILTNRRSNVKYTACIIDEATQCTEIECLFPIMLNVDKFILVGDPQQLPAVICNKEAQDVGFGKSLFTRIYENFVNNRDNSPMKMLCEQYRMNPAICDYPNRKFYDGALKSSPICTNPIQPHLKPYLVFNLMNPATSYNKSSEYENSNELDVVSCILKALNTHVVSTCKYSVGIITPYRAQVVLISRCIKEMKMNDNVSVNVNTVDSFQGTEDDIIIISCVRFSQNCFLANEHRLNVALTRGKKAVYVIGNHSLFKQCRPLYDLRENAKQRKVLLDIPNNPLSIPSFHKLILDVR
ncbi:uncharacterized protein LOC126885939 isoform X2 [Diabrotica virgifera virgifera]|uniref:FHA domain-containing protein n=1 Tax=Diabrotica virgifera virgifera TaxID=50390 RepID=A0ABM5KEU9_DIAVI|nr:uncharacterized protein LOC126885939 isoform X2 [Diabrotica virgifera virgifera]